MEKMPSAYPNPPKAPVKMIKVPVKRPVGAPPVRMVKVPVGGVPNPQGAVPVRMIKMPVPAGGAAQRAPMPPVRQPVPQAVKQPVMPPAPPVVPEPVKAMPAYQEPSIPLPQAPEILVPSMPSYDEEEMVYEEEQDFIEEEERPVGMAGFPFPKDIVEEIAKQKTPEQKLINFSLLLRFWAEKMVDKGKMTLPPLKLHIPRTQEECQAFKPTDMSEMISMAVGDVQTLIRLFPRLKQLNESTIPVDRLLEKEALRISKQERSSVEEQFGVALLMVKTDFEIQECEETIQECRQNQMDEINEIKSIEAEEKAMQSRFVQAIKRKGFPIDAEKLVRNYFTFAKKEPEKAYQILTTNPFFFSPVIVEKLPKKCFGFVKGGAADAIALNKSLAAFLKKLKA